MSVERDGSVFVDHVFKFAIGELQNGVSTKDHRFVQPGRSC